ncbi:MULTISPECIES: thioesterase family protein [Modicisalibacter]|uniref:acyl-CoA thioesterase n=1 Tax=Modicisalibacter TaxID=574347 RepID=UPI00100B685F|nr:MULTISPECIES: thioesterase family protein [Halomonadaceae]MBZ9560460.1 acyl-CoA thioesterase [Modicisalibacter sp. R2A 31.J]MBZ9575136.1 acyl-CoA thioesterase [Modicisalibacter sp. MOD 31.J]
MDQRIARSTLRVRGFHLDGYQHVNNARYLEFLEEGRWAYFEKQFDLAKLFNEGLAAVAVNLNINYRRAAVMHDELEILTSLSSLNHRSAVIHQVINRIADGKRIADADFTFVLLDTRSGRAMAIDGELRETLQRHVLDAPAGTE